MADQREGGPPPVETPPSADVAAKNWLRRRGLAGIKIALFGGLLPLAMFWLMSWLDPEPGGRSLYDKILDRGFGVLYPLSFLVMLVSEILAFGYGVEAWRCFAGKMALVAVFAVIGGVCLFFYVSVMEQGLW